MEDLRNCVEYFHYQSIFFEKVSVFEQLIDHVWRPSMQAEIVSSLKTNSLKTNICDKKDSEV